MKFRLFKIRLNKQGYTKTGMYFGIGQPLYCYFTDEGYSYLNAPHYIRAYDREHAKTLVKMVNRTATFFI